MTFGQFKKLINDETSIGDAVEICMIDFDDTAKSPDDLLMFINDDEELVIVKE